MHPSLDRLDLGAAFPDERGEVVACFIQADRREGPQTPEESALAIVIAITRCLVARTAAEASGRRPFRVIYVKSGEAPPSLARAVDAAGGTLVREIGPAVAGAPERTPRFDALVRLVDDACTRLADEAWARAGATPSLEDLAAYERRVEPVHRSEDAPAYSAELITLGALAASVLRRSGAEVEWRPRSGLVPFSLILRGAHGDVELDVFAAAQRRLDRDPPDARAEGVAALVAKALGETVRESPPFAAYQALTGMRLTPELLEARALVGAATDAVGRGHAEQLARACSDALRQWGVEIGDAVRWITQAAMDTDLRPVGRPVLALLAAAHRGHDGERGLVEAIAPFGRALERVRATHQLDGMREDWLADLDFRSAAALGLQVPAGAPRFAGAYFRDLPNPFAPLLAVWATGYVVEAMGEDGITLLMIQPSLQG